MVSVGLDAHSLSSSSLHHILFIVNVVDTTIITATEIQHTPSSHLASWLCLLCLLCLRVCVCFCASGRSGTGNGDLLGSRIWFLLPIDSPPGAQLEVALAPKGGPGAGRKGEGRGRTKAHRAQTSGRGGEREAKQRGSSSTSQRAKVVVQPRHTHTLAVPPVVAHPFLTHCFFLYARNTPSSPPFTRNHHTLECSVCAYSIWFSLHTYPFHHLPPPLLPARHVFLPPNGKGCFLVRRDCFYKGRRRRTSDEERSA